ncbi:hypothetical protein SS37A_20350 [Methylocystis iwaonis]|uniref:Uncharacterized protein n=1 Tax=Methylocystis iwaonis TaxID=2885079 RepID=A0ABM8E945_9HYPH|nr:hypothetical protein SS37A_20350 [Methylocystis iwaonis]
MTAARKEARRTPREKAFWTPVPRMEKAPTRRTALLPKLQRASFPPMARGAACAAEKHPSNLIRVMPAEGMPGQGALAPLIRIPFFVRLALIRSL